MEKTGRMSGSDGVRGKVGLLFFPLKFLVVIMDVVMGGLVTRVTMLLFVLLPWYFPWSVPYSTTEGMDGSLSFKRG